MSATPVFNLTLCSPDKVFFLVLLQQSYLVAFTDLYWVVAGTILENIGSCEGNRENQLPYFYPPWEVNTKSVCILTQVLGYTVKYKLSLQDIPRALPLGTPLNTGYISQHILLLS